MWLSVWLAVFGFSTVATYIWAVREDRIPLFGSASAFAWGWLAFRGAELTQYTQDGTAITREVPVLQYFAGFMAFVSILALLLFRFGDFPPSDEATSLGEQA